MKKKYEILKNEICELNGDILYRIIAIRSFGEVKKGTIGGFIASEKNLSQKGTCWVHDDAKVANKGKVFEDAQIYNGVKVINNGKVYGNAKIRNGVLIDNNVRVYGNADITGLSLITHNVRIYGNAKIVNTLLYNETRVFDNAYLNGYRVHIGGKSKIYGNAKVTGETEIKNSNIYGNSEIHNVGFIKESNIFGNTKLIDLMDERIRYMNINNNKIQKRNKKGKIIIHNPYF